MFYISLDTNSISILRTAVCCSVQNRFRYFACFTISIGAGPLPTVHALLSSLGEGGLSPNPGLSTLLIISIRIRAEMGVEHNCCVRKRPKSKPSLGVGHANICACTGETQRLYDSPVVSPSFSFLINV